MNLQRYPKALCRGISILILFYLNTIFCLAQDYQEKGKASFYANKFEGRKTANGEIFSNSKLTAAHKTLPFNTMVKVTNLDNGKSVVVRINDRGPFIKGRIIDLSQAAAKELDFVVKGITSVKIEIVRQPLHPDSLYKQLFPKPLPSFSLPELRVDVLH